MQNIIIGFKNSGSPDAYLEWASDKVVMRMTSYRPLVLFITSFVGFNLMSVSAMLILHCIATGHEPCLDWRVSVPMFFIRALIRVSKTLRSQLQGRTQA